MQIGVHATFRFIPNVIEWSVIFVTDMSVYEESMSKESLFRDGDEPFDVKFPSAAALFP